MTKRFSIRFQPVEHQLKERWPLILEELTCLLENGDFARCARGVQHRLSQGDLTVRDRAILSMLLARCRLAQQSLGEALAAGTVALASAGEAGEWDVHGRTLLVMGTACIGLRQFDKALVHLNRYLRSLTRYEGSRRLEGAVWRSIGIAFQGKLDSRRALDALQRAVEWFTEQGLDRSAFACIHDMVAIYLQQHELSPGHSLDPVAFLLQAERTLARRNQTESYFQATYLYDRAAAYLAECRFKRALICALRALEARPADPGMAFHCYLIIHRCHLVNDPKEAFRYALAAEGAAVRLRSGDLALLARQAARQAVSLAGPGAVREWGAEFAALGVEMAPYMLASTAEVSN